MGPIELNQLRKELGLTQNGLAQKVGVAESQISRWESGESPIPYAAAKLVRIEAALAEDEGME